MAKCDLDSGEPSPTAVANWKVRFSELLNTVLTAEKKKLKRVKQQTSINFSFFSIFFNHAISSCATIVIYHKTSDKVWEAWSRQSKLPLIEVEKSTVYWVISCWVFFLETMLLKWLSFFFFFWRFNKLTSRTESLRQAVGFNAFPASNSGRSVRRAHFHALQSFSFRTVPCSCATTDVCAFISRV